MLNLGKRIRRANRAQNNQAENRANPTVAAKGVTAPVLSNNASTVNIDSNSPAEEKDEECDTETSAFPEWLEEVIKCPKDIEFLQPNRIVEEKSRKSIVSSTPSIYASLKPWQTRLLELHAGKSGVSCTLIDVDIIDGHGLGVVETSEVVHYEALSYAWGDPTPVCSIQCNGVDIGIALELATALEYLRPQAGKRYLWVDALCINQGDLPEKARQVKNMLRIFEKADSVIAWLGVPCSSSGKFFCAMRHVEYSTRHVNLRKFEGSGQQTSDALISLNAALHSHLASTWFVRTWIRQEVFAAKILFIQIGWQKIRFEDFIHKVELLEDIIKSALSPTTWNVIPPTWGVYQSEYQHRGTDQPNFKLGVNLPSYVDYWRMVLRSGALFQVSDERDRIYGALGLLTSASVRFFAHLPADPQLLASTFPIDYNKKFTEVCEDVTKYLINTTTTLEMLDIFGDRTRLEPSNLPSWGTDWGRNKQDFNPLSFIKDQNYGWGNLFTGPLKQDYTETGKLKLRGVTIAGRLTNLDIKKEILHPRDRFSPNYRKSITLQDIMRSPTRKVSGGLVNEIQNPPFSIVFTRVDENQKVFVKTNITIKSQDLDSSFANFLAGSSYVFAYVEDRSDESSFDMADLHLLVPRTASLYDIVVSFFGSRCLHLLRVVPHLSNTYIYLGPVAAVACGLEYTLKYAARGSAFTKSIPQSTAPGSLKTEEFILV
ncbi:heterokaryon incompatibility protein-domain-containing protein [Tricladium varicosporioides]|nr:heterokaryon incompatibility protein-domain-containing protein [Hymenoscyphus varicosporioides]